MKVWIAEYGQNTDHNHYLMESLNMLLGKVGGKSKKKKKIKFKFQKHMGSCTSVLVIFPPEPSLHSAPKQSHCEYTSLYPESGL